MIQGNSQDAKSVTITIGEGSDLVAFGIEPGSQLVAIGHWRPHSIESIPDSRLVLIAFRNHKKVWRRIRHKDGQTWVEDPNGKRFTGSFNVLVEAVGILPPTLRRGMWSQVPRRVLERLQEDRGELVFFGEYCRSEQSTFASLGLSVGAYYAIAGYIGYDGKILVSDFPDGSILQVRDLWSDISHENEGLLCRVQRINNVCHIITISGNTIPAEGAQFAVDSQVLGWGMVSPEAADRLHPLITSVECTPGVGRLGQVC